METLTATTARKKLFQLLADLGQKFSDPIKITSMKGDAVLLSDNEYSGMVETIKILQNKYLATKISAGLDASIESCIPMDKLF